VEHPHPAQRTGSERADPEGAGSDAARTSRSGGSDEVHDAEPVALGHGKLCGAVAYSVLDADVSSASDEHAYPDAYEFPHRRAEPDTDANRHGIADDCGRVVAHDLLIDARGDRHLNANADPMTSDGSANGRG
jgi:hypothetical protein